MRLLYLSKQHFFFKSWRTRRHAAIGVQSKRAPLEHHLVLPAHQVGVDQGQAGFLHALAHHLLALATLAQVVGRGIDGEQHLRPGLARAAGGLGIPGILTDQQAQAQAINLEHAAVSARHEVATLVEHLVVGQVLLGVGLLDAARAQHAGGVVAQVAAAFADPMRQALRMAHHHSQAGQGRCRRHHLGQGLLTGCEKRRPQIKILGGVAAQGQLGRQQQPGSGRVGILGSANDLAGVARQVAHHEIELGDADGEGHREKGEKTRLIMPAAPMPRGPAVLAP